MSKTIKNCFDKNLTFQKLMEAHYRARKNKTFKPELISFEFNLENNISNLLNSIKKNNYHLGKYRSFKVYEPKERVIKALPYIDRIVHQWYVEEFIKPYIVPKFINTSFACITDKGTHKAVKEVQNQLRIYLRNYGDFWILKCDIKKFFYNIDPNILYNIMKKNISDKKLLKFTYLLIFDNREKREFVGIPIGNYTSQFFFFFYLNELDQYIKNILHIKYYTRYMDDFILLLKTKNDCKIIKRKIEIFLQKKLHLELNDKSRFYPYKMGVNFCGYRIFTTHKLLRTNSKKKIKRKIKKWNFEFHKGNLNIINATQSINSWIGHSSHCNSYSLQRKILNSCDFLYSTSNYSKIELELVELIENADKL